MWGAISQLWDCCYIGRSLLWQEGAGTFGGWPQQDQIVEPAIAISRVLQP